MEHWEKTKRPVPRYQAWPEGNWWPGTVCCRRELDPDRCFCRLQRPAPPRIKTTRKNVWKKRVKGINLCRRRGQRIILNCRNYFCLIKRFTGRLCYRHEPITGHSDKHYRSKVWRRHRYSINPFYSLFIRWYQKLCLRLSTRVYDELKQ